MGHALALVLVVLFVRLGVWQIARHEARAAENARIEAQLSEAPQPFAALVPADDFVSVPEGAALPDAEPTPEEALYRRTFAEGRWDGSATVRLRNRTYRGQAGWRVLTPLVVAPDRAVLVDRGWIPRDAGPRATAAPDGTVAIEGIVVPDDDPPTAGFAARFGPRDPPPSDVDGRLERAYFGDATRIAADVPYALAPVLLRLETVVEPATGTAAAGDATGPTPVPLEPREPGPHRGYALQWFAFALIGVVGYAFLMRRQARDEG